MQVTTFLTKIKQKQKTVPTIKRLLKWESYVQWLFTAIANERKQQMRG